MKKKREGGGKENKNAIYNGHMVLAAKPMERSIICVANPREDCYMDKGQSKIAKPTIAPPV